MEKIYEKDIDILILQRGVVTEHLNKIAEEACGCYYCEMQPWQRNDLSKEELTEYAEQMRLMLDKIFNLTQVEELS